MWVWISISVSMRTHVGAGSGLCVLNDSSLSKEGLVGPQRPSFGESQADLLFAKCLTALLQGPRNRDQSHTSNKLPKLPPKSRTFSIPIWFLLTALCTRLRSICTTWGHRLCSS